MNGVAVDTALASINNVVFASSTEKSQTFYDDWSKVYDEHMVILGSSYAPEAGKMFEKYGKDCKVMLDLGGGTGAVTEHVRKAGYQGIVDIMDANLGMLLQASSKENLKIRNIIRHFITENGNLPLKDELYDVVTCAGCFIPNHVPATALRGVIDVIRKNGYFIVTTRSKSTETYKVEFDAIVDELKSDGKVELLEIKEFVHFPNSNEDTKSMVYVLKKL